MKKKIGICIVVVAAVAILVAAGLEVYTKHVTRRLYDLVYEDIASVKVVANPPGKEAQLGEEEVQELLGILDMVKVYKKDNSYGEYSGQWVEFEITRTDGRVLEVAAIAPFLVIDGSGYQGNYEACQRMNGLANRVIDAAPVNLEQDKIEIMVARRGEWEYSTNLMPEEKGVYGLLPEQEATILSILQSGEWKEGTADCFNDCFILINGDVVNYHSDCGTINDEKGEKRLVLTADDKETLNAILQRYITIGPELPARMARVKGKVYHDTGKVSEALRCGVMDGKIESTVEAGEVPAQDNQSNFGAGYGYQYGAGGTIEINVDGKWLIFEAAND